LLNPDRLPVFEHAIDVDQLFYICCDWQKIHHMAFKERRFFCSVQRIFPIGNKVPASTSRSYRRAIRFSKRNIKLPVTLWRL
jgi:hypothetical protein